jgi:mannitol-1-phosphate 5-dehydrogenase
MKAVHIGPGNIGRGLIGQLLHQSGYYVVFLGITSSRIAALNKQKSYRVTHVSHNGQHTTNVTGFCAASILEDRDTATWHIATADLLTCSIGAQNLQHIVPVVAEGLARRDRALPPISIIACENLLGASEALARQVSGYLTRGGAALADHGKAIYANSIIDCIVPAQGDTSGLDITVEAYREWVVDSTTFLSYKVPHITGITWALDLEPYAERKLFTVNTAHAAAAYYGYELGCTTIQQAMAHLVVLHHVTEALHETGALLVQKHHFNPCEHEEYIRTTISRISNPYLTDVITRVGRSPIRKLGRYERIIGPAAQLDSYGMPVTALLIVVQKAFQFQGVLSDKESALLAELLRTEHLSNVVTTICGLQPRCSLHGKIVATIGSLYKV